MLRLKLLGAMALSRDGAPVPLPASRKTRALLAYLAVSDRPARRERLCEMLWELPSDPRGGLRWSLSKIRALVDADGSGRIIADRETVRLDCRDIDIDWRVLRDSAGADLHLADTSDLLRAASAGVFLEGLELPLCDSFQAWLAASRDEVRRWRARLQRELLQRDLGAEQALEAARSWVRLEPFDEDARATLVDRLNRSGLAQAPPQRRLDEAAPSGDDAVVDAPADCQAGAAMPVQHVRFCTASDGTGLAYAVVGEGPPLVKAANWLNHLEYDWASPVWRHWLRALAHGRQLVRYDERGNGLSDWDTPEISFEAFVDDLASVVEAAGLDRFDLLGISQGCSVSIAYAVHHPERVRRLVLYGGYAAGWRVRATPGEIERRDAMRTLIREGWGQNNPAFRQLFTTLFVPGASHEEAEWFNELQRLSTSPENAERLQSAFGDIDVRGLLAQVGVPTLVLHAREDAVVPFAAGRALATGIPGAEFVALESRNHLLLEHEPAWPRLIESVTAFLQ